MTASDRLAEVLGGIERGVFPPTDGTIEVVHPPNGHAAVVAFTEHILIAADVPQDWVDGQLPPGDLSAPLDPPFLSALCDRLQRRVNCIDLVTFGGRLHGPAPLELTEVTDSSHPRVARAHRYRSEVRAYEIEGGMVLLGRGLAGRWETAFEIAPELRGRGIGRKLAEAARHLVPDGPGVWAQASPGNAVSVRVLQAAGFRPVGSEALLVSANVRALSG